MLLLSIVFLRSGTANNASGRLLGSACAAPLRQFREGGGRRRHGSWGWDAIMGTNNHSATAVLE